MSVQSYLSTTSSKLILSTTEEANIATSIATLNKRLIEYFGGTTIQEKFIFGSYVRDTILPRKADEDSDIDYMLVFDNSSNKKPQSFLDRLKNFIEAKYSTSERYQSYPTIVLELNHIKFELIPAYEAYISGYYIPYKGYEGDTWISTDPNSLKQKLIDKNKTHNFLIKPLVRLLKYWNVQQGLVYSSYKIENFVIDNYFVYKENIKEIFYEAISDLPTSDLSTTKTDKVKRAKAIINNVKEFEKNGKTAAAETEMQKLIPIYA